MDYRIPSAGERDAFGAIAAHSFHFGVDETVPWFERAGHEQLRTAMVDGQVAAGLIRIPMGQFYGGRSVPMVGIAGVAVAPEHRGHGVATAMMIRCVQELAKEGVALSTLFPASVRLYRQSGFEQAGLVFGQTVPLATLQLHRAERLEVGHLRLRPLNAGDRAVTEARSIERQRQRQGMLHRGGYLWSRAYYHKMFGQSHGVGVFDGDELCGHAWYGQTTDADQPSLALRDVSADDAAVGLKLWQHFASYSTIFTNLLHYLPPDDPWLGLLPEANATVQLKTPWMLRIVDMPAAMALRGWPTLAAAHLGLQISQDPAGLLDGSWQLAVHGGRATCVRAGSLQGLPTLGMDVRALAALYTGYRTAGQLRHMGWLRGDDAAVAVAEALFAAQVPAMAEMF
ncbi:MAG: GNAT family N-acetyltransferase [Deltaproteobacteria bacterium]|nr:GNAT family N-acetyltransferase [Deltaproteobacteria bacterium]